MKKNIFSTNDYNSDDGILTSIWGPPLWHFLHTISFNYPIKPSKEQKESYLVFFTSLKDILPCKSCRDNYAINLIEYPINSYVLKNRDHFSKWLFELHQKVNTDLGKKLELTYEEVRERYEHFRSRCIIDPKDKKPNSCVNKFFGIKSKCILNIVPKETKLKTFIIDSKCKIKK